MERVAARAEVDKSTIYRRWPTKGALLAAAVAATPFRTFGAEAPDLGDLKTDLTALADDIRAVAREPRTRAVIDALHAASDDPQIRDALDGFWETRLAITTEVIQRGIERAADPSAANAGVAATMFVGAVHLEVVARRSDPSPSWWRDLVGATMQAAGIAA